MLKRILPVIIILLTGFSSWAQIPTDGLVAYYSFNGNADDESGNGHHGTLNDNVFFDSAGKIEQAAYFDPGGGYISVPDHADFDFDTGDFTIMCWFKTRRRNGFIFSKRTNTSCSSATGPTIALKIANEDSLSGMVRQSVTKNYVIVPDLLEMGHWHHTAFIREGTLLKLYMDGDLIVSENISSDLDLTTGNDVWFGNSHYCNGEPLFGFIDEMRIYKRALSSGEVESTYNYESSQVIDGLIAHYPFNGNAEDESGNGYHGTEHGNLTLATDRFGNTNSAFEFDGLDDWIEVAHTDDLDFNNNEGDEYSAFCWIKTTESGRIITKHESDGNNDPGYLLNISSGQLNLHFESTPGPIHQDITGSNITNNWHQVGFTLNASLDEVKLYLDGVLEITADISAHGSSSNTFPLSIGSRNGTAVFLEGLIDDIRIYNYALSETEISDLYHEGGWPYAEMISIPAGEFSMGSNGKTDEQPVHTVYLNAYYIDKYEVTNAKYATYLNEALSTGKIEVSSSSVTKDGNELLDLDASDCQISYSSGSFVVDSGKENYPVIEVSWYGADAYAKHYGKRLPTEAEWEKAARGTDQRTYPWGNDSPTANHCNFDNNVGHTTPVGQYSPTGDSPYGCSDMAGNLWDWCNDWYSASYYSSSPTNNPQGPSSGSRRVLRGNSWNSPANSMRCTRRYSREPSTFVCDYGFRCVRQNESGDPDISIAPESKNYGDVKVGENSSATFTVTNDGSADLQISSVIITGTNSDQFKIVSGGGSFAITPGASHNVVTDFNPTSTGTKNAALRFASNDPNENPLDVALSGTGVPEPVPDIAVSPNSKNYGNVQVGTSSSGMFVVTNEGTANLEVSSVSLTGTNSDQFNIVSGGGSFAITPGSTHNVVTDFNPTTTGTKNAALRFASNDPDESLVDVDLTGNGVPEPVPEISITPESKNYGDVKVGENSSATFTVTNNGSADLQVSSVAIEGANADQFNIVSGGGSFTLAPSANRNIIVNFTPTATGTRNATLKIASNDADESLVEIALTGVGVVPDIAVTPASKNFGNVTLNSSSSAIFTVKNAGTADLEISLVAIEGTDTDQFKIVSGGGATISPNATHNITIDFTPTTTGAKSALLKIISNDPDESPLELALTGSGINEPVPDISITPEERDFGDTQTGSSTLASFIIKNQGTADLEITSFSITGTDADQFSTNTGGEPITLVANATKAVTVRFNPTAEGEKRATLQIDSNDPDPGEKPLNVPLSGNGVVAPVPDIAVDLSTSEYNFGDVEVGTNSSKIIAITNAGTANLDITLITITGTNTDQFSITGGGGAVTIIPGDTNKVEVNFNPSITGDKRATLHIECNDPDEAQLNITLKGNGAAEPVPDINLAEPVRNFGKVPVDSDSSAIITISNEGGKKLEISSTAISGTDVDQFLIVSGSGAQTVQAKSVHEVTIKFMPSTIGDKRAALKIISDDSDEPVVEVTLTGEAVSGPLPEIQLSKNTHNYGEINAETIASAAFTVSNSGKATLNVSSMEITGANSDQFYLVGGGAFALAPAEERQVEVNFYPTSSGHKIALLKIVSNDPDYPTIEIFLTGKGVAVPQISASATQLSYANVIISNYQDKTIFISNQGSQTLNVTEIKITGTDANLFSFVNGDGSFAIAKGSNPHEIVIRFSPVEANSKLAMLSITSNDPDSDNNPLEISLTAVGIIDPTPATIAPAPISSPPLSGQKFTLTATLSDDETRIMSASLYCRPGGQTGFDAYNMINSSGNQWNANVPESRMTERGLEYYIQASHGGATTVFPSDGTKNPRSIAVSVSYLAFPFYTWSNVYQMISIPIDAESKAIADLIGDDLGTYNTSNYRIFDWNQATGKFIELSENNLQLPPGKAVWLITKESISLDIGSGKSVTTESSYPIQLKKGWNMIGVPFAFNVAWSQVNISNISGGELYFYDKSSWIIASTMEPFKGYAVKALADGVLEIPPVEAGTLAKSQPCNLADGEWQIQLKAENSGYQDFFNFAGARQHAGNEWDNADSPEPPVIGKYVSLYFNHANWPENSGKYSADFRTPSAKGYEFDFTVESNLETAAVLNVEPQNLPNDYDWTIVSRETQVKYENKSILLPLSNYNLKLLVGTKEFLAAELVDYKLMPTKFELSQNFPNPFNPQTTIRYALPKPERVTLQLFNLVGRSVIKLLDNELKPAGYHDIVWNSRNKTGQQVASGIYWYVFKAGNFRLVRRMAVVK